MYNIFQKEQRERDELNRSINDLKEKKVKEKRKSILIFYKGDLPELVNKYDSRIKSFIIDVIC